MSARPSAYAVSDLHGHADVLVSALGDVGLCDTDGRWSGGESELWLLGDYVDRGPDGIGVLDLAMRLSEEAAREGGAVHALLGNHEMLMLGMHRFSDRPVPAAEHHSFAVSWLRNGGQERDQELLEPRHLDWLTALPAVAVTHDQLLVHSDTTAYLQWGRSAEEINAAVSTALAEPDLDTWWRMWQQLTLRYEFLGDEGASAVEKMLGALGGSRIVHGHSIVSTYHDREPRPDDQPLSYADGRALAIDGGIYAGGPCLVVPLP